MQIIRLHQDSFAFWQNQIEKLFNTSVKINFPETEVDSFYGKNKCEDVIKFLKNSSAIVFAAIEDDKLAGWIWCHEILRMNTKRIHIAEIAVADDWQRQGVGCLLLKEVERYAVDNDYKEIDLLVTASNGVAVKFYEKDDFKPERYLMKKVIAKLV